MQFKLAALATISAVTFSAATEGSGSLSNQCNAGTLLCCLTLGLSGSASITNLLKFLGIPAVSDNDLVGLDCIPINAGENSWYVYMRIRKIKSLLIRLLKPFDDRLLHRFPLPYANINRRIHVVWGCIDFLLTDGLVALGCTPTALP